ncbi:MAG: sigma 54-interacting transcriptional regulator [Thermodesulfobacteriota bacterium]
MAPKSIDHTMDQLDRDLLEAIVDNPYECPIIIDTKGIIRFISHYSEELIGVDPVTAIGRHVKEVIKETNLHEVVETGRAKIGETLFIGGRLQIISRIPLRNREGKIIGAIGKAMLHHESKVMEIQRRLDVLNSKLRYYRDEIKSLKGPRVLIGQSDPIQMAKKLALQVSGSNFPVLITGESGTGKETIAYYIHRNSKRADGPFIRVNCAAIPPELIESELFGYEAGAFTGARAQGKPGKFELANNGTILLDEIGDMPLTMQAKLLRVLQEQELEHIGGTTTIKLDYRLITSTNKNLRGMMEKGIFREDLYYRISSFHIRAPSLRSIREDIPVIVRHLMSILNQEIGAYPTDISDEAMEMLKKYHWPGNVRELKNVLERGLIMARGEQLKPEHLPGHITGFQTKNDSFVPSHGSLREKLADMERQIIVDTLRSVGSNRIKAARILGIHRSSLYEKMKQYNVL